MHTIFSMSNYKAVSWNTTVRAAMLRRSRDGRARHLADAMAMIQTSDGEEREHHTETRMSEPESEVDYLQNSQTVSEAAALPSTVPVTGESFCPCYRQEEISPGLTFSSDCPCGEEDQDFDWEWDDEFTSTGVFLSCDNRKVSFHSDYSCGTAAIRGTKELADGQHFFEVKMTSPVYGTDMMVGIGTSEVNLEKFKYSFGSLLGHDADSWGLSYTGHLHHKGDKVKFSSKFGQGSIIGVHLDTWHGTLTFYKNRRCIGVAATHLQNKKLYPMVCSTAAKSSMKVIRACYTPTSLQYLCCTRIRQLLPSCLDILSSTDLPPGLKTRLQLQLGWIFTLSSSVASEQHWDSPENFHQASGLLCSRSPSPVSTLSAYDSASHCTSPLPDTAPQQCACQTSAHSLPCTCHCPPTPPSSDHDSCCSEPEDYQCKRCRWA